MKEVVIPPVGALDAVRDEGDVLFDSEALGENVRFFQNPRSFAVHCGIKKFGTHTNLHGMGGCLPQGFLKHLRRVRVDLLDDDHGAEELTKSEWIGVALHVACSEKHVGSADPIRFGEWVEWQGLKTQRLLPLEAFDVRVSASSALYGRRVKVSLDGPMDKARAG